jgi:hypothetical protein
MSSLRPMSLARPAALLCVPLLALGVSACAGTTSSNDYKGENHAVAAAIANLQTYATAGEAQKICSEVLASAVTARLDSQPGGCKRALKDQLSQVDTPTLTVQEVKPLGATGASAEVKSTYAGNSKVTTITLVKEDGAWKISKLG